MKVIVGLGNIDKVHENTYHNMGFMALDYLAKVYGVNNYKNDCKAKIGSTIINGEKVLFVKPQTYMNRSGESVVAIKNKYKLLPSDFYVICDDIDLPVGKVRFREKGSGGTHNGLRNIVLHIGQDFNRVKIGIGRDEKFADLADFVVSKIPKDKLEILENCYEEVENIIKLKLGK